MEFGGRLLVPGWFRVYSGAMFTGKTREFINEFSRIGRCNIPYLAFKPTIDDRFPPTVIQSRGSIEQLQCRPIPPEHPEQILDHITPDIMAVGIDEMQFFGDRLFPVIEYLRDKNLYVVGTALELNFRGEPFELASKLISYADDNPRSTGACTIEGCLFPGDRTQRLTNGQPSHYSEEVLRIDHGDEYFLRCRKHHVVPGKPKLYDIVFNG